MENQALGNLLQQTVEAAYQRLRTELSEEQSAQATQPGKWSPKQLIGHLIDSASNNHQRFVRANYRNDLLFPGYRQEDWVKLQDYQQMDWSELLSLWRGFNLLIARVMNNIPKGVLNRPRVHHNLDKIAWKRISGSDSATLAYFMEDYIAHLEHHIRQILPDYKALIETGG